MSVDDENDEKHENDEKRATDPVAVLEQLTDPASATPAEAPLLPAHLCRAVVRVLPVDGAAISVRLGGEISVPIGASDPAAAGAEQLQFTLGEGPCLSAGRTGNLVLAPDLELPALREVWPTYVAETLRRSPFRAVFSFPLAVLGVPMGTLNLYRRVPDGALPRAELDRTERIADRIATVLYRADLFRPAEDGDDGEHPWFEGVGARQRQRVWLAQGMTMQARVLSAREALTLLRARAYADDRLIDDLADDIVQGRVEPPGDGE